MKHSVFFTCGALFFIACAAVAQSPQYTLETSAVDSVPQTTIVPVQQAPVEVVEHTTVYEEPAAGMDRAQRRAYKARAYAAKIDSLVQSRDYMFFPNSMQQLPGGMIRSIYADYFFFGVFVDHVEVHLPTERGITLPGGPRAVGVVGLLQHFRRQRPLPRRFRRLDRHGRNGADTPDTRRHDALRRLAVEQAGERPEVPEAGLKTVKAVWDRQPFFG